MTPPTIDERCHAQWLAQQCPELAHVHLITVDDLRILLEQNATLREEFALFIDHFKCFEYTSAVATDRVAFARARAVLATPSP